MNARVSAWNDVPAIPEHHNLDNGIIGDLILYPMIYIQLVTRCARLLLTLNNPRTISDLLLPFVRDIECETGSANLLTFL